MTRQGMDLVEYNARVVEAWQQTLKPGNKLTPSGELIVADLLETCAVFAPLPCTNAKTGEIDAHALAIAEGRRQVVLRILRALSLDPFTVRNSKEILDGQAS